MQRRSWRMAAHNGAFDASPSQRANTCSSSGSSSGARINRTANLADLTISALSGFGGARRLLRILVGLVVVNAASFSSPVRAEDMAGAQLMRCNSIVSFDKRLLMSNGQCQGIATDRGRA